MNAASALVSTIDRNSGAERLAAIIASRALRFGDNVLGAIINRVRIVRMRNRNCLVGTIWSTAEGFVVGPRGSAPITSRKVGVSVVIRIGSEALSFSTDEVQAEHASR